MCKNYNKNFNNEKIICQYCKKVSFNNEKNICQYCKMYLSLSLDFAFAVKGHCTYPYLIFVADAADIVRGEFSFHVEKFRCVDILDVEKF